MKSLNSFIKCISLLVIFGINLFASEDVVTKKVNEYLNTIKAKDLKVAESMIDDEADFIRVNKIINKIIFINNKCFEGLLEKNIKYNMIPRL